MTKLLINEGADIDLKDSKHSSTPLLYACQNGRTKLVRVLLEKGADINAKSSNGTMAVHFAAQSGNRDN